MKAVLVVFLAVLLVTGCKTSGGPVVDYSNSPAAAAGRDYSSDLAACQSVASQADGSLEQGAKQGLGGAALGAATGAIIGAIIGQPGRGAAIGATTGGAGGIARGAAQGADRKDAIVRQCMRDRGWNAY